mgnify:FL=1
MNRYSYKIELFFNNEWITVITRGKEYCQGWLDLYKDHAPRNPARLLRSDGKVLEETSGRDDVDIGMIAGWPTPEQYERAAEEAIQKAESIKQNQRKQK